MCWVKIALFAISAETIVPFTIFAEVTELSAIAEAVPVTFPSTFATRVPVVILKLPVLDPVAVVVPSVNLSALSSHANIALSPVLPLSITIPLSLAFEPTPLLSSIRLSETTILVTLLVLVEPFTV